jgi:hypothetical protein
MQPSLSSEATRRSRKETRIVNLCPDCLKQVRCLFDGTGSLRQIEHKIAGMKPCVDGSHRLAREPVIM